jgi:hypothetical protein
LRTLLGLSNQDLNEHTAKLEADARALWSYRVIRAAAGLSARPARDALFAMVQLDERLMLNRAAAIFPELPESVRQELGPDPDTQRGGR